VFYQVGRKSANASFPAATAAPRMTPVRIGVQLALVKVRPGPTPALRQPRADEFGSDI
jgi:hypothetical protein